VVNPPLFSSDKFKRPAPPSPPPLFSIKEVKKNEWPLPPTVKQLAHGFYLDETSFNLLKA
jgi:hypothetical protein